MPLIPPAGPVRVLTGMSLVNTFGNGLWMTGSALFFTRSVGLSATQVGLGLTVAGAVGLTVSVPLGSLADRYGARTPTLVLLSLQALLSLALLLVRGFPSFLVVVVLRQVADAGSSGVRGALVAAVGGADRLALRARLRAVTNLGISGGAALAGVALAVDTRPAYVALVVGDALTFVLAALVLRRLPATPRPGPPPEGTRRWEALRDRPFLAVTAATGVMSLQYEVLVLAVPLWLVAATRAPRAMVAVLLLVNTAMCVLLQVRASRGVDTPARAASAVRRSGWALLVAMVLYAAASGRAPGVAVALLVLGTVVATVAELWHAAGQFALSYELAEPHALGQYQAVFGLGFGVTQAVGPVLLTTAVVGTGVAGWVGLGIGFALVGLTLPRLAGWAARTRLAAFAA